MPSTNGVVHKEAYWVQAISYPQQFLCGGSNDHPTFTVTDVNGGSVTQSDVVTILNTDPTVSSPASISASPSPITTGVLTRSASFSDYNDGSLTPTYAWTLLDGTPLCRSWQYAHHRSEHNKPNG